MPMRTRILEVLPDDLRLFEPDLARIVPEGLSLYVTRYGMQRAAMSVKTERCGINDCLIEVAKKFFPGQYAEKRRLFLLCLGSYRIKLKKLSKKLRTSNNTTQLVLDFLAQKLDDLFTGDLFHATPVTTLHLGYIPDDIDLLKSTSWITCPNVTRLDWIYEIKPESGQVPGPVPPATQPDDSPPKPVVTPKRSDIPETGESQES